LIFYLNWVNKTGYTSSVRTLAVIVVLLAVFGASTQCVADCLTQPTIPPCHQHSQSKSCNHVQPAADTPAICPPAAETPALDEVAFEFLAPQSLLPDGIQWSSSVLRL
jgi:hypothetical protein